MCRIITLIILLFFSTTECFAQDPTFEIEYLFTVASHYEADESGFLMNPDLVTTDQTGKIFVADHSLRTVKVYSSTGEFIDNYGGQGNGPGEFRIISDIKIDDEGNLLALDRMSLKVSRFDVIEEEIHEHFFEDMDQINIMTFETLSPERIIGPYVEVSFPGHQDPEPIKAFRIYNFGVGEKESSHFEIFKYQFNQDDPLEDNLGRGIGHKLSSIDEHNVVVGHNVYKGSLFLVNLTNNNVIQTTNEQVKPPYYQKMNIDVSNELPDISGFVMSGSLNYQMLYHTQLLQVSNQKIVHIIQKNRQGQRGYEYWMEVYSKQGSLLLFKPITSYFTDTNPYQRYFAHIDQYGRLFVVNEYDDRDPEVQVYQVQLGDLE